MIIDYLFLCSASCSNEMRKVNKWLNTYLLQRMNRDINGLNTLVTYVVTSASMSDFGPHKVLDTLGIFNSQFLSQPVILSMANTMVATMISELKSGSRLSFFSETAPRTYRQTSWQFYSQSDLSTEWDELLQGRAVRLAEPHVFFISLSISRIDIILP